jgi:hypothetical protein
MNVTQKLFLGVTATILIATDANAGRWLSRDPIQEGAGFVQRDPMPEWSLIPNGGDEPNLYVFVLNDPVNGFDPFGLATVNLKYETYIETTTVTFKPPLVGKARTFNGGVKTRHSVNVDTDANTVTRVEKYIGPTIEYGPTGNIIGRGQASGSTVKAYVAYFNPRTLVVIMEGDEGNPLVRFAPGITYSVGVTFDRCTRKMTWKGSHDKFPSHDFYEQGKRVHHFSHTAAGTSPLYLFPEAPNERFKGEDRF